MLEKDPNKRITISEIMLHEWISKYKDQKMKRQWGYFSSSSDESLNLDEDTQTTSFTNAEKFYSKPVEVCAVKDEVPVSPCKGEEGKNAHEYFLRSQYKFSPTKQV